ncbi:MAG: hypothetical protein LBL23_02810 [Coriobacteriales bacterium]|nr:hypothetical protein [Coriobacteriales bacterium]
MLNTFYCSPDKLNLVMGSATATGILVDDFRQIPLPDGAMINGIITNVDVMCDFLDTIAKEYHLQGGATGSNQLLSSPSRIIIQAANIVTKILEVPPVDDAQIREIIRREFTQYEDVSELESTTLYDYTVLNQRGPNGGVEIMAASASREMIEDYRRAFVQATYNVEQIGVGVEALIKLVSLLPQLTGQTYMLAQVEAARMTVAMFVDGTFRLFNGYRLTSELGSEAWIGEIGQNLASMLQFSRAQRGQTELGQVFFAGVTPQGIDRLKADFEYLNVALQHFDLSGVVSVSDKITADRQFDPGMLLFNLGALVKRA